MALLNEKEVRAGMLVAWIFGIISLITYITSVVSPSWSVAIPLDSANGELGIYYFCPNTQSFINGSEEILDYLNITAVDTGCTIVDWNCNIELGITVQEEDGIPGFMFVSYNIFEPLPFRPVNDSAYELLKVFPGEGSCSGYNASRILGTIAAAMALVGFFAGPCALFLPNLRQKTGRAGLFCALGAVVCGAITLGVWAGTVIDYTTSAYGSGFRSMVAAVAFGGLALPCLAASAMVPADAWEKQIPYAATVPAGMLLQQEAGHYYGYTTHSVSAATQPSLMQQAAAPTSRRRY